MNLSAPPRPRLSSLHALTTGIGTIYSVVASAYVPLPSTPPLKSTSPSASPCPPTSHQMVKHRPTSTAASMASQPGVAQMHLSTPCDNCGENVVMAVPGWMTDAMEQATAARHGEGERQVETEWREGFVGTAVMLATAIKASPIPAVCVAFVKALFQFMLYLDGRFQLHQRMAVVLAAIVSGLMEFEKEVGLFRNAGETISVLWEASVKSGIAFASTESQPIPVPSSPPTTTAAPPSPPTVSSPLLKTPSRTLRPSHSTPHLPLLFAAGANSSTTATSTIPFPSDTNSNAAIMLEDREGGAQLKRRRSRSVNGGRVRGRVQSEQTERGWTGRVVMGVVGRVVGGGRSD